MLHKHLIAQLAIIFMEDLRPVLILMLPTHKPFNLSSDSKRK